MYHKEGLHLKFVWFYYNIATANTDCDHEIVQEGGISSYNNSNGDTKLEEANTTQEHMLQSPKHMIDSGYLKKSSWTVFSWICILWPGRIFAGLKPNVVITAQQIFRQITVWGNLSAITRVIVENWETSIYKQSFSHMFEHGFVIASYI